MPWTCWTTSTQFRFVDGLVNETWSSFEVRGIYENLAAASGLTAAPFIPMVPAQPGHLASVAS